MTDKKSASSFQFNYRILSARGHNDQDEQAQQWRRAVFDWWLGLEERKGERADLRRCQQGEQAMQLLGYFRLKNALSGLKVAGKDRARALASVAYILSFIKPNKDGLDQLDKNEITPDDFFESLMSNQQGLSYFLGQKVDEQAEKPKPVFHTLRFQRLLQAAADSHHDDFDVVFRRAVRQLQNSKENNAEGKKHALINPVIVADQILYRYHATQYPDTHKGEHKFEYQFAKDYWQQVLEYQKES